MCLVIPQSIRHHFISVLKCNTITDATVHATEYSQFIYQTVGDIFLPQEFTHLAYLRPLGISISILWQHQLPREISKTKLDLCEDLVNSLIKIT